MCHVTEMAGRAHVSTARVSCVHKGSARVGTKRRERVFAAEGAVDYNAGSVARRIASRRSRGEVHGVSPDPHIFWQGV